MFVAPARWWMLMARFLIVAITWGRCGADLATILVERDVSDPVEPVLYTPVAAGPGRDPGRRAFR